MHDRSRRTILRECTADAHASLDRMIGTFDSLASYKAYLCGMAAFRIPVETMLAQLSWPDRLMPWSNQEFGALILADLADLDLLPDTEVAPPALKGAPEDMLGVLYVLEGSALGARLLYRRAQALGLTADYGARHLAAQAARSDRWPRFLLLLESADAIEMDRVAEASRAAFTVAETAFRKTAHVAH